jgi:histone deacetylase 1/2
MASSDKLSATDGTPLSSDESTHYRSIVGGLQYLTMTRPGISFAVNKVYQFLHAPRCTHWSVVKCILHHVQATLSHGLFLQPAATSSLHFLMLIGLVILMTGDQRGGHAIFYGSNLIASNARKQATISRYSIESEYKTLANATAEL